MAKHCSKPVFFLWTSFKVIISKRLFSFLTYMSSGTQMRLGWLRFSLQHRSSLHGWVSGLSEWLWGMRDPQNHFGVGFFFFLAKQQYLKLVSCNLYFRKTANILVQRECIILNEKSINNSIWWVFNVKICSFLISHYMYWLMLTVLVMPFLQGFVYFIDWEM